MDTSTPNRKQPSLESHRRIWIIPLLVVILILLNHHFQWYPWPWLETSPPERKQLESPGMNRPKPAPVVDYQKIEEDSHPDMGEISSSAGEQSESPVTKQLKPAPVVDYQKIEEDSHPHPGALSSPEGEQSESPVTKQLKPAPVIDYQKIKDDSHQDLKEMVQKRKKDFGLEKSVDMVAKHGEQIRVGKETIHLSQILAEIDAKKKSSEQTYLQKEAPSATGSPTAPPPVSPTKQPDSYYGIYVVRPGDNLWNIHFALLREYFGARGTVILPIADEPLSHRSSGVGCMLKYAEKMVYIFNLKTKMLSMDLDLLQPQEKIVIFNLSNLNKILSPLSAEQIDAIRFDGQDLILQE